MLGFKEIQVEVFVGVEIIPLFHKSMNLDIIHQNYALIKVKNQHGLNMKNGNASFEPFFGGNIYRYSRYRDGDHTSKLFNLLQYLNDLLRCSVSYMYNQGSFQHLKNCHHSSLKGESETYIKYGAQQMLKGVLKYIKR